MNRHRGNITRALRGIPPPYFCRQSRSLPQNRGTSPIIRRLSGREVVKAFEKDGWQVARQRGSHIVLVKDGYMAALSVPDHREVAKGTLRSLIRAGDLTVEAFLALANRR